MNGAFYVIPAQAGIHSSLSSPLLKSVPAKTGEAISTHK